MIFFKEFDSYWLKRTSLKMVFLSLAIGFYFLPARGQKKLRAMDGDSTAERQIIESKFYFFNGIREKNLGNLDLAVENFRKSVDLYDKNDAAYYEIARVYSQKADFPNALENIRHALEIEKSNGYYLTFTADLHMQLGQGKEALKLYEEVIRKEPKNIEAYLSIAAIYENQKDFKEANKYYSLAEELTGPVLEISQQKINNFITAGKFDLAIAEIQKLISEYPEDLQFKEMLADIYMFSNQQAKANELLGTILKANPESGGANLKMARASLADNKIPEGLAFANKAFADPAVPIDAKMDLMFLFFDKSEKDKTYLKDIYQLGETLTKTHSDDAKSFSIYGDFLNREGKIQQARDQFRKAVELAPSKHLIWQEILNIDTQLGDYEGLAKDSEKCISLFPTIPAFYFYNGLANYQQKNYNKAVENLEGGIALVIDNNELKAQFHATLGDTYNATKNFKKSDHNYEEALKLAPDDLYVLNNYSYFLSLRGEKLEKAAEMAARVNQLSPDQPNYQDTYGWVLYKMKRFEEARVQLEKAIQNGGKSGEIFEHYGDVLYKLGNTAQALEYWQKARSAGDTSDRIEMKIREQKLIE